MFRPADEGAVDGEDLVLHVLGLDRHEPELGHEGGVVQFCVEISQLGWNDNVNLTDMLQGFQNTAVLFLIQINSSVTQCF